MTEAEYRELQDRFTKKSESYSEKYGGACPKYAETYRQAVLACKSIVKSVYEKSLREA